MPDRLLLTLRGWRVALLVALALLPALGVARGAQQATWPTIEVSGEAEIVYNWSRDRCALNDYPDVPARAFRDADGRVQLIASHYNSRRAIGPDLDHLHHECPVILESDKNGDPAMHDDYEWITGVYTEDGQTIYATVHNEYRGSEHHGRCPSGQYLKCWFNVLTLAVSTDGGASYHEAQPPPNHLIASLPYAYVPDGGPVGMFEASNIIKGKDGFYYEMVRIERPGNGVQWTCLMRTNNLGDPKSWRGWDGNSFTVRFIDPYIETGEAPERHLCQAISRREIGWMHDSLSYNTVLDRYVLVSAVDGSLEGASAPGIYYSFSEDLIHWSPAQLLIRSGVHNPNNSSATTSVAYASILDPNSPSRNFETSDADAYVYFTRYNLKAGGIVGSDRDLMRVPIHFRVADPPTVARLATATRIELDARIGGSVDVDGFLLDASGQPIVNVAVDLEATQTNPAGGVYQFAKTGVVPRGSVTALVGYRVNVECGCSSPADVYFYRAGFNAAGESRNRIPNPTFTRDLGYWGVFGDLPPRLEPSNLGSGKMVHTRVGAGQSSGLNSTAFLVTPGDSYTLAITARVLPGAEDGGYFTLIFLDANKHEVERNRLPLHPNAFPLGSITTGPDGSFTAELHDVPLNTGTLVARFRGDAAHFATVAYARWEG